MARTTLIVLFHGNLVNLPLLERGEPAFVLDQGELYIGNGFANVPIGQARIPDGDKVDIVVTDSGATWTIKAGVVSLAKLADIASGSIIGRATAGAGVPEALTLSQLLDLISPGSMADGDMLIRTGTSWTRLPAPAGPLYQLGNPNEPSVCWTPTSPIILQDVKAANTAGGTSVAATWNARTLNTKLVDQNGICTLASNAFSLPKGSYHVSARAPSYNANKNRLRLRETTFGTIWYGQCVYNDMNSMMLAELECVIGAQASYSFVLEHWTQIALATFGLGVPCNDGGTELYAQVTITPLALLP